MCIPFRYTSYPFFFPCFLFRSALFSFQCARVNTSVFTECLPFGILLRETTPLGISLCETLPAGIILRITPMREILLRKTRFRDYPSHNPYAGDFASQNSLSGFPSETLSREILLRKTRFRDFLRKPFRGRFCFAKLLGNSENFCSLSSLSRSFIAIPTHLPAIFISFP